MEQTDSHRNMRCTGNRYYNPTSHKWPQPLPPVSFYVGEDYSLTAGLAGILHLSRRVLSSV